MKDDGCTYLDLTPAERKARARLTPKEQMAVDNLVAAIKALPPSLCCATTDFSDDAEHFTISKRITRGSATQVAKVRKKSIIF
jgi:hypothetical protein